jgi:aldehyde dehydrogenase (NAD+)
MQYGLMIFVYREKPLALYVFANDEKTVKKFVAETSSGAVCANDTLIYFSGKDR